MAKYFGVLFAACAVILCTGQPVENLPILKEAPKEVLFRVSESSHPFLLECKIANGDGQGVQFSWHKDGKPMSLENSEITQRRGEGSLIFLNPKDSDAGQYQCFATTNLGTASTRLINVRQTYINAPKPNLQEIQPVEGKPFKLDCSIPDAYPKPQITWVSQQITDPQLASEVNDARITVAPEGTLYFSSAEKHDANKKFKYVCLGITPASDDGVPLAEYVIVDVADNKNQDNEVYEQYTTKDVTLNAGEYTYLYCIFGGVPLAHPDWFKGDIDINGATGDRVTRYNRSKGKRLLIREVLLSDAGTYRCVADNEKSKPKEHTFKVSVIAAPRAVNVPQGISGVASGKDITIPCQVSGMPAPKISWTYNGKALTPSQSVTVSQSTKDNVTVGDLTIRGAQASQKGYYGCQAENKHGDIYSETLLNVI